MFHGSLVPCAERRIIRMKTIAIIDDDIHIGDMLTEVLTQEGYAVLRASL